MLANTMFKFDREAEMIEIAKRQTLVTIRSLIEKGDTEGGLFAACVQDMARYNERLLTLRGE